MAQNTASQQLYDLLVSKNFDLKALDSKTNNPPVNAEGEPDNSQADKFVFDYVPSSGRNYGTVVIYVNSKNITLMFGDNIGKTMEGDDKTEWFNFMYQIKQLATKNFLMFEPANISKERYVRDTQATVTEGLLESWQGKGNISWNGKPTEARLIIKHKKSLNEDEARFRFIESIYVETSEGERFKLKSRSLMAGKAMLEHVRQGGFPYDVRGQHINEIVEELSVLSRFRRANAGKILEGDTKSLVEQTDAYYKNMHSVLKHLGTNRGYQGYFESWSPTEVTGGNLVVEDLKQLFVEQTIDHRIEEALPILARITKESNSMKEAQIFESWINNLVEGTWAIPETPEARQTLVDLLSKDFPVGPDATNAKEQLYDIFGDDELFDQLEELADADANADARSIVITRMQQLSNMPDFQSVLDQIQLDQPEPTDNEVDADALGQEVAADEQLPQEVEEGVPLGYSKDPAQGKWYHEGRKAYKYGTTGNTIQDIARKHGVPPEWIQAFHAGYEDQQGWGKDDVAEGQCNMSEAGAYCPEHGLEECSVVSGSIAPLEEYTGNWTNFGLEESDQLNQLKRLALGK